MPQAARCFGHPRPFRPLGHAGRPNRPHFPTITGASGGGDCKKTMKTGLVEVLGTFFLSLALFKGYDTILLALGCGLMLALGVWFGGGAYNPAVSIASTGSSILGKPAWARCPPLAVPQPGSRASSGGAWRLWAVRHSQEEAGPLGAHASHCPGCST